MEKKALAFNEKFSEVFEWESFKNYLKVFWPIFYGWYSSYVSIEIVLILIGNTHDIDFLAAWCITFPIVVFVYVCGVGVSQITRTDVIMAVQQHQPMKAQKYAYLGIIMKSILLVIIGLILIIFSKQISQNFTT